MNKSLVVAIVVIAAIVVGIPLAANLMKSSPASSGDSEPSSSSSESAATPTAPPGLDANSLTNTQWSIKIEGVPVPLTVTLLPNGALTAQAPILKTVVGTDTVGGTWSVNGANLSISASAGGKTVNETAVISGDQLLIKGKPAQRLR